MPGKVNPVMPELMNEICFKAIGNDLTVTMASQDGLLQLNAYEPVVAVAIMESQGLFFQDHAVVPNQLHRWHYGEQISIG
jgi:aspartate ammonia-lyase